MVSTVNKVNKKFSLSRYGKRLWTRDLAQRIRTDLLRQVSVIEPGAVVVIDADGVEVFDFSFANELFGKTLMTLPREHPDRHVAIENLSEYARENLERALEGLSLVMVEHRGSRRDLIGKINPVYRETFAAIAHSGRPISAAELKEQLGVAVTAMNERLTRLTELGVIHRERGASAAGREQYLYLVPR
jgi:hypothetical protein